LFFVRAFKKLKMLKLLVFLCVQFIFGLFLSIIFSIIFLEYWGRFMYVYKKQKMVISEFITHF